MNVQIMTIPRLSERLESMLFRRRLDMDIAEARPELDILRHAASELRASARFKKVLQVRIVAKPSRSTLLTFQLLERAHRR